MREILFRGKSEIPDSHDWVTGDLVHFGNSLYIYDSTVVRGYTLVMPDTVGQWTGLVDMNGVKIFEGDIVSSGGHLHIVKFGTCSKNQNYHSGYIGFYVTSTDEMLNAYGLRSDILFWHGEYGMAVIGNIHDNPELLQEGAKE